MRNFVIQISEYAKNINPNFVVIPQNGVEVMTNNGLATGVVQQNFMNAIDGWAQEDLFYGLDSDNVATKSQDTKYLASYLNVAKSYGKKILATDYCYDQSKMKDSYTKNFQKGYISFAAEKRSLNNIPSFPSKPNNENSNNILSLNDAKNFLYLINPEKYSSKSSFINALKKTNHDLIIMDAFLDDKLYTKAEIESLKTKSNGGKRLVISYMSIGEAENYRYYWKNWKVGSPSFVDKQNPEWKGNFKVKYWDANWKAIIFGNDSSYTKKIVNSGFDGVYLDIIDGFEYYENL